MVRITLKVEGMRCGMCEAHVNDAVRRSVMVKRVKASHAKGEVLVVAETADAEQEVRAAIEAQGYRVRSSEIEPCEERGLFHRKKG